MSRILTLVFIFSTSTCTLTLGQEKSDNVITDRYRTKNFDCVIFPEDYLTLLGGTRFAPTREQVDLAERVLKERLKEINQPLINQGDKHNPIIHKKLKKYRRQYFGFTDEQGNKILLINCFWNQKGRYEYWETERVMVLDGGSNYWSIRFNLETEELFELDINGSG